MKRWGEWELHFQKIALIWHIKQNLHGFCSDAFIYITKNCIRQWKSIDLCSCDWSGQLLSFLSIFQFIHIETQTMSIFKPIIHYFVYSLIHVEPIQMSYGRSSKNAHLIAFLFHSKAELLLNSQVVRYFYIYK